MKIRAMFVAVGFLAAFTTMTGCSEKTEQAAETAVEGAAQDTAANAAKTGEAVEGAAEATGEAVAGAAEATGEAVAKTGEYAAEAVGGAAKEVQDAGQSMTLTPTVKNALIADKQINASTIDVDTSGEKDTVVIKGTVASEAAKKRATVVAMKALKDAGSSFKVKNELMVGKSKM